MPTSGSEPAPPAAEVPAPPSASVTPTYLLGETLISAEAIAARVAELGAAIAADYAGQSLLLVGVLKGAFVFLSDLARAIAMPVDLDFLAVSSYGASTRSSGVVRILKDLDVDIAGRHVLLVEDIVDSGLTLAYLREHLGAREPASVEVCAFLARERIPASELAAIRYVGFRIPDAFVVGYGLDAGQRWRNLPDLRVLAAT